MQAVGGGAQEQGGAHDGARALGGDVGGELEDAAVHLAGGLLVAGEPEGEGHGGVEVAAGDVADGVGKDEDADAKAQRGDDPAAAAAGSAVVLST